MEPDVAAANARFGTNVRRIREERGVSQEAFAQLVGVHRTYVGNLERGKHSPTLGTMLRVSRALGVEPSKLIDGIH